MLNRSMIILAFVLLIAATTAQDVVLHAKGVKPPSKPFNGAKPPRQGAQHPGANLQSVVMRIPDPSTRLVEENQLGSFAKSGAPFKSTRSFSVQKRITFGLTSMKSVRMRGRWSTILRK
jgi:hypothetical protein